MKNWIGKWVMFVALGHTVVAFGFFAKDYRLIAAEGFFNTVKSERAGLAVWFALFGLLLFIVGMLISAIEKNGSPVPPTAAAMLFFLTLLGVLLMPMSGFWLMFPAIFAVLYRHGRSRSALAA